MLFVCLNNWRKRTDLTETGKTAGRADVLVGTGVIVSRKISSSVLGITFEVPIRHSRKDMQNAVRDLSLDFWGEI